MMRKTLKTIGIASILISVIGWPAVHAQSSPSTDDIEMAEKFMQTAQAFVQSAVGGDGNVRVVIEGDVASLFGYVNSVVTKNKAERAALKDIRVNSVRNRLVVN